MPILFETSKASCIPYKDLFIKIRTRTVVKSLCIRLLWSQNQYQNVTYFRSSWQKFQLPGDSFVTFIDSPLKTINCRMKRKFTFVHLRGDSGLKVSTEKNRHTNVKNKWIRKENWLQKHLNLKLSKSTFRMQFAPSCKSKM